MIHSISVKIGEVYRIRMTPEDGITPKPGDTDRHKFFVVLGFDDEGNVYGGVIVNSKINPNLSEEIKDLHMPIKADKYAFLRYNSFVDCSRLKTASIDKLLAGKFLGAMDKYDVELIVGALKESPKENKAHLALFGL